MSEVNKVNKKSSEQLTTFYVGGDLFGIKVLDVQEVTGTPSIFSVPLAPPFVRGLINLRGQIATALDLREVFSKPASEEQNEMSVICKNDDNLLSLIVDSIGDVVDLDSSNFEPVPDTIPVEVRRFLTGIYKMNGALLSVLDLDALAKELSPLSTETSSGRSH